MTGYQAHLVCPDLLSIHKKNVACLKQNVAKVSAGCKARIAKAKQRKRHRAGAAGMLGRRRRAGSS